MLETATWPKDVAQPRRPRERLTTSWALEPGAYVVRGMRRRTVETLILRPLRGGGFQSRRLAHEASMCAGQLTVMFEAHRGGELQVTVDHRTIRLRRVHPHLLAGSLEEDASGVHFELKSRSKSAQLTYVLVTKDEQVSRKRVDLSNAFTAEKWHEYLEVRQVTTVESLFTAQIGLDVLSLAPGPDEVDGTDQSPRPSLSAEILPGFVTSSQIIALDD